MTAQIRGLVGEIPTQNEQLISWISESVELFQPESVVFVDGSQEEADRLAAELVEKGTLIKLNEEKRPNSFLARSNPSDVARVESRTFICTEKEEDAGPTNNWMDPAQMKAEMTEAFRGSVKGARCTSCRSAWAPSTIRSRSSAFSSLTPPTSCSPCAS